MSKKNKAKKAKKWGVFEYATGVVWQVNPPTKENAEKEAKLVADKGLHEAMPLKWAYKMRNAFYYGHTPTW